MIFNIDVFETYKGSRFGYNGLILSQGLTPFIYMAATAIFWAYKDKKMLFLVFILIVLSGVKGAYFGAFLLLTLLLLYNQNLSKIFKLKILFVISTLFVVMVIALFSLPIFKEVIQADGLISAIFSYRTDNFLNILSFRTSDNFNLFFGANGLCPVIVEMQALDIFLFFGLTGIICYTFIIIFIYKDAVKGTQSRSFYISVILLSTLSGNLFYNPVASTLFIITLFCLDKIGTNDLRSKPIE